MVSTFRGPLAAVALEILCAIARLWRALNEVSLRHPSQSLADACARWPPDGSQLVFTGQRANHRGAPWGLHRGRSDRSVLRGTNLIGTRTDALVVVRQVPAAKGRNVAAAPKPSPTGPRAGSDPRPIPAAAGVRPDRRSRPVAGGARHRGEAVEPAYSIPMAMSVLSGAGLRARAWSRVGPRNPVPSVIVGRDAFGININVRGVTTIDKHQQGRAGGRLYVERRHARAPPGGRSGHVPLGVGWRILRGPGGAYEQSTTGGVINVVTNQQTISSRRAATWSSATL